MISPGKLHDIRFDYVCVSFGGSAPAARPAIAPGYQVPLVSLPTPWCTEEQPVGIVFVFDSP